ncbi:hypothetical protein D3C80_1886240 [compost metagenome]
MASATPTRVMLLAPIATRVSAPTSVITTFAAKVAAVIPRLAMSIRSWPPAGLASKSRMRSWPKPAAKRKTSLPSPPVRESFPVPPCMVFERPLPTPVKLAAPM